MFLVKWVIPGQEWPSPWTRLVPSPLPPPALPSGNMLRNPLFPGIRVFEQFPLHSTSVYSMSPPVHPLSPRTGASPPPLAKAPSYFPAPKSSGHIPIPTRPVPFLLLPQLAHRLIATP